MLSVAERPLNASAAMLSCCSIRPAPTAAKAITRAITWRWRDSRSSRNASLPETPSSSGTTAPPRPAAASRRAIRVTIPAHSSRMPALHSSRLSVPTRLTTTAVRPAPVMPPRLEPPPMKPKMRLACRAS